MADFRIITVDNTQVKCYDNGNVVTFNIRRNKWKLRIAKPDKYGYCRIRLNEKKHYFVHRLILQAFYGESDKPADHINRVRSDNRLVNLQYSDHLNNNINTSLVINAKGYCWIEKLQKWYARIRIHGKTKYLGLFDTVEDARNAYVFAREERDILYKSYIK